MARPRKDVTFAEAEVPAIEHAKALAKEASKKREVPKKEFYTKRDGKYLKITVKPNGAYSTYIGQFGKGVTKVDEDKWKSEGVWHHEHEIDQICSEFIESCQR